MFQQQQQAMQNQVQQQLQQAQQAMQNQVHQQLQQAQQQVQQQIQQVQQQGQQLQQQMQQVQQQVGQIPIILQRIDRIDAAMHNFRAHRNNQHCGREQNLHILQSEVIGANLGIPMQGFPATPADIETLTHADLTAINIYYNANIGNEINTPVGTRRINLLRFLGVRTYSN
jgi:seryl-tRNA synthetase